MKKEKEAIKVLKDFFKAKIIKAVKEEETSSIKEYNDYLYQLCQLENSGLDDLECE